MDDGKVSVVLDPYSGLGIRPPSASADVVLMTHEHHDHSASDVISGDHTDFMRRNGKFICSGIQVEGFPTFHDDEGGRKRGLNTIYRLSMDGVSVCHCGDIGAIPSADVLNGMKGADILMVPVGEVYTMSIEKIKELIDAVGPKVVIPMHYRVSGLAVPLNGPEEFLKAAGCKVNSVGNEADISKEKLPKEREIWMFSR